MSANKGTPVRFSLLTVFVWLLVAGGIIFLLWQVINRISGSNLPPSTGSDNPTQAQQTIAARLTAQSSHQASTVPPTTTPSPVTDPTETSSSPLSTPQKTSTARMPTATATPVVLCNRAGAGNPIDVTIPDDSLISPGQSFIKTWKLVNVGRCSWTTSYSARFFYGDQMNAPDSVPMPKNVPVSNNVEISVEMIAPPVPGTYQGNWKLSDPEGALFGIGPNGDSPFWVRIIVAEISTATPTVTSGPTVTFTPTGNVTPTPTPEGQMSGELLPVPGDSIDLDALTLNSGEIDLIYQVDANQYHWLAPQGEAMIGVYGNQQPGQAECASTNMSSAPIAVESLPTGTYLCYQTGEGRTGRMLLAALDPTTFTLTLDLLTWALP
ncbi:MAG TPA: NBR1-Ig-like domain-containing protein [Anaerolineales bacterium]|nr:NBR1-Ig-like domain-containing protein [Anaerolineales bacterium]